MICFDMVPVRYFRLLVKVEHRRCLSLVILGKIRNERHTHRLHGGIDYKKVICVCLNTHLGLWV